MTAVDPKKRKGWRRHARACRLTVMLLVVLVFAPVIYLNEYGLPDFLSKKIINELRAHGVDLQFSRMRLVWYRGLVAEDVNVTSAKSEDDVPQLSAREIDVDLDLAALAHGHLKVDGLGVRGGQVDWSLSKPGQTPESLSIAGIQTRLLFSDTNRWELENFSGIFAGTRLHLSGSITNGEAIRDWNIFRGHGQAQPEVLLRRLRNIARVIRSIRFSKAPELNMMVHGDARNTSTFDSIIALNAPGVTAPWCTFTNFSLFAKLSPSPDLNGISKAQVRFKAQDIGTKWGDVEDFRFEVHALGDDKLTNLIHAHVDVSAREVNTPWAQTTAAHLTAHWTHSLTNLIPDGGTADLRLTDARTRWGRADEIQLGARLSTLPTNNTPIPDESWAWWAKLQPYRLDWDCKLKEVRAEDFESKEVLCGGNWLAPELIITNLVTVMYGGQLTARADLNVTNRVLHFGVDSSFDAQKIYPFLTSRGKNWWREQAFGWEKPPIAHARGEVTLPVWTNHHPDWREVQSSLLVRADLKVGKGSYRNAKVDSVVSHLIYSNRVCTLPDLVAIRPEGKVNLFLMSDDKSQDYYLKFHSTVDPKATRGFFNNSNTLQAFDRTANRLVFTQAPLMDAEVWGRWHHWERSGFRGTLTVSNMAFRGESIGRLSSNFDYTNHFILLTGARLERPTNQVATAESVGISIDGKCAYLTNCSSTVDPVAVVHVIGPKVTEMMSPYHFENPPAAKVSGVIPLSDDISMANVRFDLVGGPFNWMGFHTRYIMGTILWQDQRVSINDVRTTNFYGGTLTGTAGLNCDKRIVGTDFDFNVNITQVSLAGLVTDIANTTNHLDGLISGNLNITHANSHDKKSWQGKGHADLTDGSIWEIPVFGVLSDVLDKYIGVGKSRVSDGTADFIITNSVIGFVQPNYLQLSSPSIRLLYRGTVDFDQKIDLKVDADPGYNIPVFGKVFSWIMSPFEKWLLEIKVTGTLANPKHELAMFVPRELLSTVFHPFRAIKDTFSGKDEKNPPASTPTPPPSLAP